MGDAERGRMPWRARLHDAAGHLAGGGVLLGNKYVLTCAHVIEQIGGPGSEAVVDFVGAPDGVRVPARVVPGGWVPPDERMHGDLALLELAGTVEAGLGTSLRRISSSWGRAVRVYGFPPGADFGIWVRARLVGPSGPGRERIQLDVPDGQVGPGFSGCPVVDDATGRPLGIVAAGHTAGAAAWMIPAETVVQYFPQVARWVVATSVLEERLDQLVVQAGGPPAAESHDLYVPLPKGALPDPLDMLIEDPVWPESQRFCGTCGHPTGRDRGRGFPALVQGFCEVCGAPFDYRPSLRPGDTVGGLYTVLGCLSRGGLSWIHLALDEGADGRLVVLKGLKTGDRRLEVLAAAQRPLLPELDHPDLVRTLGFADHADLATGRTETYLVMEYVRGLSLRSVTRQAKRLRPEHVAAYGLQILDVIGYLHGRGLLYGDMKPSNVMQVGDRVKVIDLGALRRMDDHVSAIIGTQGYQPGPEELQRHGVTVRSDLFAVGRTLSELLKACEPALPALGMEVLEALISRAVAGYDERFATAEEMAEQLRGVLRQLLSMRDRVPRPVRSTVFAGPASAVAGGLSVPDWGEWSDTDPPARCDVPPPAAQLAAALPGLLPGHAATPLASWWDQARTTLADDERRAEPIFRRCASAVAGELAAWLALGACAELQGLTHVAGQYYEAVWSRDRGEVAAAFGLARTRLAAADRVGAAAVLDDVPGDSEHADAARVAAIRALAARLPGEPGLPAPEEVATALHRLAQAGPGGGVRDRLTAVVLETALEVVRTSPVHPARLPGEHELRDRLRRLYHDAANADTSSKPIFVRLLEQAHRFRNRIISGGAEPVLEIEVGQNKYLSEQDTEMHVVISVSTSGTSGALTLRVRPTPGHQLKSARQLSPVEARLSASVTEPGVLVPLGEWVTAETRQYALEFTVERRGQFDEDQLLARIDVEGDRIRSSTHPVLVHWTEEIDDFAVNEQVAAATGLVEAVETATLAYQAGDQDEALDALGRAVAMAANQRNEGVLRRLTRLVDIVDAEYGLVSLRGPVGDFGRDEWDYLSERLSAPVREAELVGSRAATSFRTSVRLVIASPAAVTLTEDDLPADPPRFERPPEPLPAQPPALRATVQCLSDEPVLAGRPVRVSVAVHRVERLEPLLEPVRLRVLLDAVPGVVEPVSRLAWLSVDRHTERVEFDVVPVQPGPLRLVFRIYREFDSHLLLEVVATLAVERIEVSP